MTTIRVVFANICQGLNYEGRLNNKGVYSRYWPSAYKDQYLALKPDIICFAEAPLDDEQGTSTFVEDVAKELGAASQYTDVHEKSWLIEGKLYGTAIISKFPITQYTSFKLPAPKLEIDRPDGLHWVLHSKSMQSALVQVNGTAIRLFNLHYFPFHYFCRNMNEPDFEPVRRSLVDQLRLPEGSPTILTGDFNNSDDELEVAFPELFENSALAEAIHFGKGQFDDHYDSRHQLDHILVAPRHFTVQHADVIRDRSDHRGILADVSIV